MPTLTSKDMFLAPAFRQRWQLWIFIIFVSATALFPLLPKGDLIDRGKLYYDMVGRYNYGNLKRINDTILSYPGDIDILFVGASNTLHGIMPNILMDDLPNIIGKKPVILRFAHDSNLPLLDYMVIKDLLAKKKIGLILYQLNPSFPVATDLGVSEFMWDFGLHREVMPSLSSEEKSKLYFQSVFISLRNIYAALRSTDNVYSACTPGDSPADTAKCIDSKVRDMNLLFAEKYSQNPPISPMPSEIAITEVIHWRMPSIAEPEDIAHWRMPSTAGPVCNNYFFKEDIRPKTLLFSNIPELQYSAKSPAGAKGILNTIVSTAHKHGTAIAFIRIPAYDDIQRFDQIMVPEMQQSDDAFNVPIIAITLKDLSPGLRNFKPFDYTDEKHIGKDHLTREGADYFTRAITPAVGYLYNSLVLPKRSDTTGTPQ